MNRFGNNNRSACRACEAQSMVVVCRTSPPRFEVKSRVSVLNDRRISHKKPPSVHLHHLVYLDLLETQLEYDEEAAESLINVDVTLFQEVKCSVDSVSVDLQITCPRCKTKTTSNERLVVCSNSSCAATFRSKATSVRVEFIVTETGN